MSNNPTSAFFFDTDGRPQPAATAEQLAERKLKVWAVLNAVDKGLMPVAEACAAYQVTPAPSGASLTPGAAEWWARRSGHADRGR